LALRPRHCDAPSRELEDEDPLGVALEKADGGTGHAGNGASLAGVAGRIGLTLPSKQWPGMLVSGWSGKISGKWPIGEIGPSRVAGKRGGIPGAAVQQDDQQAPAADARACEASGGRRRRH